jgi:hypothetical protein
MSGQPAREVLLPFFAAMRQFLIVFLILFAGLHSTCEAQQLQVLDSIQLRRSVIDSWSSPAIKKHANTSSAANSASAKATLFPLTCLSRPLNAAGRI